MSEARPEKSRREFFRSVGRYLTLGLIGAGGGTLAGRALDKDSQRCVNRSVCCNCAALKGCRLPAALSAKQSGRAGTDT